MVVPLESGPRKWRRSTHNNLVLDYWEEGGGLKVRKGKGSRFLQRLHMKRLQAAQV